MSIKRSVKRIFWSAAIIQIIAITAAVWLLIQSQNAQRKVLNANLELVATASELEINTLEISLGTDIYWRTGDPAVIKKIEDDIADYNHFIKLIDTGTNDSEIASVVKRVAKLNNVTVTRSRELCRLRDQMHAEFKSLSQNVAELDALLDNLLQNQESLTKSQVAMIAKFEVEIDRFSAMLPKDFELTGSAKSSDLQIEQQLHLDANKIVDSIYASDKIAASAFMQISGNAIAQAHGLHKIFEQVNIARNEQLNAGLALDHLFDNELQPIISANNIEYIENINQTTIAAFIIFLVFLSLTLFVILLSRQILKNRVLVPLYDLGDTMMRAGKSQTLVQAKIHADDEIGMLAKSFNSSIAELLQLVKMNERLDHVLAKVADFVVTCDDKNKIEFISPVLNKHLGYNDAELIGLNLSIIAPNTIVLFDSSTLEKILQPISILELTNKNGELVPVQMALTSLDNNRSVMIGRDRLPEVNAENRLAWLKTLIQNAQIQLSRESKERQALELQLLDVAEREQARIGQELHDDVGQQLAGVTFLSHALQQRLSNAERPEATDAGWISKLLSNCLNSLRQLSRDLTPTGMETGDLNQSLESLCKDIRQQYGINCQLSLQNFDAKRVSDYSITIAKNLFRICQESISNASRHGNATTIKVMLLQRSHYDVLVIIDNGSGFDTKEKSGGLGIRSIKLRASSIGGRARLSSSSDGTMVMVKFNISDRVSAGLSSGQKELDE